MEGNKRESPERNSKTNFVERLRSWRGLIGALVFGGTVVASEPLRETQDTLPTQGCLYHIPGTEQDRDHQPCGNSFSLGPVEEEQSPKASQDFIRKLQRGPLPGVLIESSVILDKGFPVWVLDNNFLKDHADKTTEQIVEDIRSAGASQDPDWADVWECIISHEFYRDTEAVVCFPKDFFPRYDEQTFDFWFENAQLDELNSFILNSPLRFGAELTLSKYRLLRSKLPPDWSMGTVIQKLQKGDKYVKEVLTGVQFETGTARGGKE